MLKKRFILALILDISHLIFYFFVMTSPPTPNKINSRLAWTPQEDEYLREQKKAEKKTSWVTISMLLHQKFPQKQRSPKQCRDRFINYAQFCHGDGINSDWSASDTIQIFQKFLKFGAKWSEISRLFPGRSENFIKNKFYGSLRKLVKMIQTDMKSKGHKCNKTINQKLLMYILTLKNQNGELDEEAQILQQLILQRLNPQYQSDPHTCSSHIGLKIKKFNDRKRSHTPKNLTKNEKFQENPYQANQFEASMQKPSPHQKCGSQFNQKELVPLIYMDESEKQWEKIKEKGAQKLLHMKLYNEEISMVRPQGLQDFDKEVEQIYNQRFQQNYDSYFLQ